jgi:hypothetical protein
VPFLNHFFLLVAVHPPLLASPQHSEQQGSSGMLCLQSHRLQIIVRMMRLTRRGHALTIHGRNKCLGHWSPEGG